MAQQRMRSSDSLAGHRCAVLQGTAVGRRQRRVRGSRRAFMIRADGQLRRSKRHMFEAPPGNHLVVASGPAYSYSARRQHHSSKNSRPTPQLHPQPHSPSTRGVPQLRRRLYHSAGSGIPQRGDATRRYMCHTLSRHPLLRNLTGRSPQLCHPRPPNPSPHQTAFTHRGPALASAARQVMASGAPRVMDTAGRPTTLSTRQTGVPAKSSVFDLVPF